MKRSRHMAAVIAAMLLAGCCGVRAPQAVEACTPLPDGQPRPVVQAPYRSGIALDGDLAEWNGVPFTQVTPASGVFDRQPARTDDPADLSFRFALCYDDDALYVAVEVTDDAIHTDSCPPGAISCPAWDDDAVEVFIDANHNHAPDSRLKDGSEMKFGGEFALIANGAANSDYSGYPKTFGRADTWQGATNWQARERGERTARYEFRITWNVMGATLRPGDRLGFSISAQDDDDGGRRDHALYWVGNPVRPFSDESFFADVSLVPRPR